MKWLVTFDNTKSKEIEASAYKIESGALVFTDAEPDQNIATVAFAPGHWASLSLLEPEKRGGYERLMKD